MPTKSRMPCVPADLLAALAKSQFRQWDYLESAASGAGAYVALVLAAEEIGVSSARLSAARRMLPSELIERYVCRPRQLQEDLVRAVLAYRDGPLFGAWGSSSVSAPAPKSDTASTDSARNMLPLGCAASRVASRIAPSTKGLT